MNGNLSGNNLDVGSKTNGVGVARVKRRESAQSGIQRGIQFLQRAAEEGLGNSDAESSLLDDLDLDEEERDTSDPRMRAEAKSMRKVTTPSYFGWFLF